MRFTNMHEITKCKSTQEILEMCELDYSIECYPRYYQRNGVFIPVEGKFSIVRDDSGLELSTASENWTPIQNEAIVDNFLSFCDDSGLKATHAGALDDGRKVCIIADLDREFDVKNVGDIVKGFVQFIGSHERGYGHQINLYIERLVCLNGATRQVRQGQRVLRHTASFEANMTQLLEACLASWEQYIGDMDTLANTVVEPEDAHMLLIKAFGDPSKAIEDQPKIVQKVFRLFDGELIGGHFSSAYKSAFGLLQSVTEYYNHHHAYRSDTDVFSALTTGNINQRVSAFENQIIRYSRSANNRQSVSVGVAQR
ncbi:DUF932 domain-containing protein [Roseofilum capinflatum]|uniref:DUF932 domain-containing protein n=1 Tax=Roseofilum capinflatum BLCC-M114 TaxID=3022440 RepID=A0ABT7B7A8_9CYAN|nr:DUF932 domain-containing protein [Roseofilum capinflatum]MDJ1174712.1 DUF932 domain-containing protein [Roseofilum capinflatum BLCC-M114]